MSERVGGGGRGAVGVRVYRSPLSYLTSKSKDSQRLKERGLKGAVIGVVGVVGAVAGVGVGVGVVQGLSTLLAGLGRRPCTLGSCNDNGSSVLVLWREAGKPCVSKA